VLAAGRVAAARLGQAARTPAQSSGDLAAAVELRGDEAEMREKMKSYDRTAFSKDDLMG